MPHSAEGRTVSLSLVCVCRVVRRTRQCLQVSRIALGILEVSGEYSLPVTNTNCASLEGLNHYLHAYV